METGVEAKRTQGKPNATRKEKTDPGNRPKPKRVTTPPETPTKAAGALDVMKTMTYGVLVQVCWAQHNRQYPDELIHKEIEEFNRQWLVCWYNLAEQERDRFQEMVDRRNAQQAAGEVVNGRQLTTRKRRLLRPTHTHKEAISKPNTETNAKDKTPTTTQPRRSDRVAMMNKATPTGRPPVGVKSSRVAEGGVQPQVTMNKNRADPRG